MRKLIFTGVISVLVIIAWIGYLKYNTKKFIEEWSSEPLPKQQVNSTVKDSTETSVDGVAKTEQAGLENTLSFSPEDTPEDVGQSNDSDAGTGSIMGVLDPEQTPEGTGISPELKKVFSEYHNLYKESEELSYVLGPLIIRSVEMSQRLTVIGQELSAARDEATKRKIRAEWAAINKLIEEDESGTFKLQFKLQDEARQLASERLRIINAYGFETEKDFLKAHRNDYETWVSDESLTPLSIFRR